MVVPHGGIVTFVRREGHIKMLLSFLSLPCECKLSKRAPISQEGSNPTTDGVNTWPPVRMDKTNDCWESLVF